MMRLLGNVLAIAMADIMLASLLSVTNRLPVFLMITLKAAGLSFEALSAPLFLTTDHIDGE